jgi:hypothetical protein
MGHLRILGVPPAKPSEVPPRCGYFNRERGVSLNAEDKGDDNTEDYEDALFDNGGAPAPPAIDPKLQPAELTEEEALELAITMGASGLRGPCQHRQRRVAIHGGPLVRVLLTPFYFLALCKLISINENYYFKKCIGLLGQLPSQTDNRRKLAISMSSVQPK